MHAQECKTRGVWGHAPPGNFQKLDALRLLLRPFWDRSRAVVATWPPAILHPIFGCSYYALVKPADFEFPIEKVLGLAEQQVE